MSSKVRLLMLLCMQGPPRRRLPGRGSPVQGRPLGLGLQLPQVPPVTAVLGPGRGAAWRHQPPAEALLLRPPSLLRGVAEWKIHVWASAGCQEPRSQWLPSKYPSLETHARLYSKTAT
mgnify:CR=1 FL=1